MRLTRLALPAATITIAGVLAIGSAIAAQADITRVSVATDGTQGTANSLNPALSFDGRYVSFLSAAPNLVAADTNGQTDVFMRDRQSGTTELVSLATGGAQGNDSSGGSTPAISADGRYVAFESFADQPGRR